MMSEQDATSQAQPHSVSGFLFKKGRIRHNWKKRWFCNPDDPVTLQYFTDQSMQRRKGTVNLSEVTEFNVSVDREEHIRFFLRTPKRTWQFYSEDQVSAQYWGSRFEQLIRQARRNAGKKVVIDNLLKDVSHL